MEVFTLDALWKPFTYLDNCKNRYQMAIHHPEGDVLTHSLQVMDWAFKETINTDLILAALFHDIGKAVDTKGHDKVGADLLREHLSAKSVWLIEQHMRFWYLILGDMRKRSKVKELLEHPWLSDLCALARWDKLGRNPNRKVYYDKEQIIERLNKCVDIHFEMNKKLNL